MAADPELDVVNQGACRNSSAVESVKPPIVQWRHFWYAHQHKAETAEGARFLIEFAKGSGD